MSIEKERKMKEIREYFFSSYWWSNIRVVMIMMLLLQFILPLIVFDSSYGNRNEFDFPSLEKNEKKEMKETRKRIRKKQREKEMRKKRKKKEKSSKYHYIENPFSSPLNWGFLDFTFLFFFFVRERRKIFSLGNDEKRKVRK